MINFFLVDFQIESLSTFRSLVLKYLFYSDGGEACRDSGDVAQWLVSEDKI